MAKLIILPSFFEDTDYVHSMDKLDEILDAVASLESFPNRGSNLLSDSIISQYGNGVKKLIVNPFDVIYEYLENEDTVLVHALLHQKAAS